MAVIIGKRAKDIGEQEAQNHVFGYSVAQDISARDWFGPKNGGQFLLGKTMDTFCPLGPSVVVKDAVRDVHNLSVRSWVNGDLKQNGNTSELVFKIDTLISHLSR